MLAKDEEFAKRFSSLKSVDEQYDFAQKSVSGYTKEEFINFLDELERSYKLKLSISPEDMEKVSGGANAKTKAAAMAMLALSAVGSAAPMLTNASASGSRVEAELGRVTADADMVGVAAGPGEENHGDDVGVSTSVRNHSGDDDDDDAEDEAKVKARLKALKKELDSYEWLKGDKWWLSKAERKDESVQQSPLNEEDYYESLTDRDFGNDRVELTFNPKRVPEIWERFGIRSMNRQLESDPDGAGWAIVGDILYFFVRERGYDGKYCYTVCDIKPLFWDESGKACNCKGEPIRVIKIPDYLNGYPIWYVRNLGNHYDINEFFPDLECLILPRTLQLISVEEILHPMHSRSLKVYVRRGTNYRYFLGDERPLQPGLHVMEPQNRDISQDVLAFPPAAPEPPVGPGCTIM